MHPQGFQVDLYGGLFRKEVRGAAKELNPQMKRDIRHKKIPGIFVAPRLWLVMAKW